MANEIQNIINFLQIAEFELHDYYQDIRDDIGIESFNKYFVVNSFHESIVNAFHGIDKDEVVTILTSLIKSSYDDSLLHLYFNYCLYEKISILDTDYPLSVEFLIQMLNKQKTSEELEVTE